VGVKLFREFHSITSVRYMRKEGTTDEPVVRGYEDEGEDNDLQQHWQGKQGNFPGFGIVGLRGKKA
jgi:hypothetical protein